MTNQSTNIQGSVIGTVAIGNEGSQISTKIASANINTASPVSDVNEPTIEELLARLREVIQEASDLPEDDKEDLLTQLEALGTVPHTPEPKKRESLVRHAKKIFSATISGLPETAKVVEACSKLLPMILKILGFPG